MVKNCVEKLKVKLEEKGYLLKHYKDGEFNKDYDRLETVESMTTFMKDPKGMCCFEIPFHFVNKLSFF